MIEVLIIISAWYAIGLIGLALIFEYGFRREGLDVLLSDVIWGLVSSVFGPLVFFAGIIFLVIYSLDRFLEKSPIDYNRIIIRARKR